ncbi:MAG: T9SS type A sorting domain-containing protein [Bacteroidales bacterium]
MKKFYLTLIGSLAILVLQAQIHHITPAGSLQVQTQEVTAPDLTVYSFHEVVAHGYYDAYRVLDYDSSNMTFMGNWPLGQSLSISHSGMEDIFLVGSGAGVIVLDASDPAAPEQISVIRARGLVDASYYDPQTARLYLGAYFSGVEIWDLTDMGNPAMLARIPTNSYPRGGVFAQGDIMYVMTVVDGLYTFDISDMNNIQQLGHYPIPGSTQVWNSAMEGNFVYCAAGTGGCRIVDVSDPANLQIAGIVGGAADGVWVHDGLLYVTSSTGLKIHDVNDPSSPSLLGNLQLEGYPYRVSVNGNHAFVANSTTNPGGGVQAVDVSDPANPQLTGSYSSYARYIAAGGDLVAFTGGGLGCTILDASDPANLQMVHNMQLPWSVNEVFVQGNLALTGSNGFRVFDVSDKYHPVQTGFHDTEGALAAASGDVVVFIPKSMTANNPVNIMDISDPHNPFKRGTYAAPVMTYDLDLKGHYAFIACWWDGFRVVDFSDPDNPSLAAHEFGWANSGSVPGVDFCYVQALDTEGDYLYLIDYQPFEDEDTKGLYVFDISDPENPALMSRYRDLTSAGYDLEVQGGYAYVSDKSGGLEVIDVSDPFNPQSTGYVYLPDVGYSVDVEGNYAYIANYILGGVQMVNVFDPANPFIEGYYQRSGCFGLGATVEGSHVYLADGIAGFGIYDNLIITSVQEPSEARDGVLIYPNPCSGFVNFTIDLFRNSDCRITVHDLSGRLVAVPYQGPAPEGKTSIGWNLRGHSGALLPAGMYMVSIHAGGDNHQIKLLITG